MFTKDHLLHLARGTSQQKRSDGNCITMLYGGHQDQRPYPVLLARSRRLHIFPSDGMEPYVLMIFKLDEMLFGVMKMKMWA